MVSGDEAEAALRDLVDALVLPDKQAHRISRVQQNGSNRD